MTDLAEGHLKEIEDFFISHVIDYIASDTFLWVYTNLEEGGEEGGRREGRRGRRGGTKKRRRRWRKR